MAAVKHIILIDPAAEATAMLAQRLQMQGYLVTVALDPAEGARLALAEPPAAVIADLWMRSISGVQLCRLLKAEPATETVPVILRGLDSPRSRFWAERAGAVFYVVKGRMGELVRSLAQAIAQTPPSEAFFTAFSQEGDDIGERIAMRLDAALFESVLAAEVRALGMCGEFDRLFDLFSQFVSRVASYRWLAVSTSEPTRLGLHVNPSTRAQAEREVKLAIGINTDARTIVVEDEDAFDDQEGPPPMVHPIELAGISIGCLVLAPRHPVNPQDAALVAVIARELAGPIRIATLVEEAHRLATIDALTGLMNRRAFIAKLASEIAHTKNGEHDLALVLLDIDHFKSINDKRGHNAGDAVLSNLGQVLYKSARSSDLVARWGGEEFVIALPDTSGENAVLAAERFRLAIEEMVVIDNDGSAIAVTASLGIAQLMPSDSIETLVERADIAMYAAKCAGRNRIQGPSESNPPIDLASRTGKSKG